LGRRRSGHTEWPGPGVSGSMPEQISEQVVPVWIDSNKPLGEAIRKLVDQPAYAIDTEFLRERTYYPKLALVQIAWPGNTVLIDPLAIDLTPLGELLESDSLAVLHAADQDLEVLEYACQTIPRKIFDTQIAAGFLGFSSPSLLTLAERILAVRLSKGDRLTDWTQRPLTVAQTTYAAADVIYLLELHDKLLAELESSGRVEWASAECELLRNRPRGVAHAEKAWWKLKDGRVLRGKDRLFAQEICRWREERARYEDKPIRFVLPDLAVVSIAQAKPKSVDELGRIRGMDGRYLKGGAADEILLALQRAGELPASALVQPEPEEFDRKLRPALTLVSAWVAQLAHDAHIDPSLLATRSDLVHFLRGDGHSRISEGWRHGLLGSAIGALVAGDAALAFESSGTLRLEKRSGEPLHPEVSKPSASWVLDAPDHRHEDDL
jgi:ribonuclease D